jgi:hypothetical protein
MAIGDKEMFELRGKPYRWKDPKWAAYLMRVYAQSPCLMRLLEAAQRKETDLPNVPTSERGFGVRDD